MNDRIFLSPPDMSGDERERLLEAFDSNWVAPAGPAIDGFEQAFSSLIDRPCVALSSGTAALHLALLLEGVTPGSQVLTSSLTFAATANAVTYLGAKPAFIDSDWETWNMDPEILADWLERAAVRNVLPSAVVTVDLYGQCVDYDRILSICANYEIPVVADSAEALGATYRGELSGRQTRLALFSFNGNKIITTSGGGMLVGESEDIARAKYLASQARLPAIFYEHEEVGYNYRMSNLLAAVGHGQLEQLDRKIARRREIFDTYADELGDLVEFMPEADFGKSTRWLSVGLLPEGVDPMNVCEEMASHNIETRPAWKPMHMQPAFASCEFLGRGVAEGIFGRGICLPSGSGLTESQQAAVVSQVRKTVKKVAK
jgi:dTDP-4-amino-4,6-dideoxygalactose transaminase